MNEVECLRFPLLGTMQDGETFQYLLLNIDDKEAEISIGSWIVRRVKLNLGEEVQLYIPSHINENFLLRKHVIGTVSAIDNDVYKITFPRGSAPASIGEIFSQKIDSCVPLTLQLVKDSLFLKEGVKVYFNHLIPYFSRIVNYTPKEYAHIKKTLLDDVLNHISDNEAQFRKLYETLCDKLKKQEEISLYINPEDLCNICES